ncbi:hypothetical protein [Streptomyces sp. Isolate_45]|uniref:hypothetical protein n=1 Tax=Streptomyces sp. Isolate_45 TaxID=2950111 RepID=UPI0024820272|nr:hypothetical protein [Streptomyces sp. Isolate_45]MDA5284637.1 hypothetical protein [Streptomyces sp. Isolate_45]
MDTIAPEFDRAAWRDQYLAETTAPGLHWTARHLDAVEHAAGPGIVAEAGAYRLTVGGRRIAAERITGLTEAGFLAAPVDGIVRATADGVEAARRIRMVPDVLMTDADWAARARRVLRANQSLSTTRAWGRVLPCLPGGAEAARRAHAAREQRAEWARQDAVRRAEVEALRARTEAREAELEARRAAEQAEAERVERYGCGRCADVAPVEARCGICQHAPFAPPVPPTPPVNVYEPQPAEDVAAVAPRRTYVSVRPFTAAGRTDARLHFSAARGWRAAEHKAVAVELASLFGLTASTPRRMLADGRPEGREETRLLLVVGAERQMTRYLRALPQVVAALERLATRAARRFGTWRRSLLAVLGGHLDAETPATLQSRARAFRSAVLARLTVAMRSGAPASSTTDVRAALWDQVNAVVAEVWEAGSVDPWTLAVDQEHHQAVAEVPEEPVAGITYRTLPVRAPAVALAA